MSNYTTITNTQLSNITITSDFASLGYSITGSARGFRDFRVPHSLKNIFYWVGNEKSGRFYNSLASAKSVFARSLPYKNVTLVRIDIQAGYMDIVRIYNTTDNNCCDVCDRKFSDVSMDEIRVLDKRARSKCDARIICEDCGRDQI